MADRSHPLRRAGTQTRCAACCAACLSDAAKHGLPGEHHFFITFRHPRDGVKHVAAATRAISASEMTIILQHQFWDLIGHATIVSRSACRSAAFRKGWWCRSAAIKSFSRYPSVQFGLTSATRDDDASAAASPRPLETSRRSRPPVPSHARRAERCAGPAGHAKPAEERRPTTDRRQPEPTPRAAAKWCGSIASARNKSRRHCADRWAHAPGIVTRTAADLAMDGTALRHRRPWPSTQVRTHVAKQTRTETDSVRPDRGRRPIAIGARRPSARAQNFRIGTERMPLPMIRALGIVKLRRRRDQSRARPARCQPRPRHRPRRATR